MLGSTILTFYVKTEFEKLHYLIGSKDESLGIAIFLILGGVEIRSFSVTEGELFLLRD